MSWLKSFVLTGGVIAGLVYVFTSIGSLGGVFNWSNPNWQRIGVDPQELQTTLSTFPANHCPPQLQGVCQSICNGVKNFLGL